MATNNVINANSTTPLIVTNGGTGANTLTIHGLLKGDAAGAVSALPAATNGQLPIGSTSNDPVLGTLTAGTGISISNGAGTITIGSLVSQGIVTLDGDTGAATGTTVTLAGGNNITTAAGSSTVTFNVSGTTNHSLQLGNSTGSLTSLGAAINGQLPIGSTGSDPVLAALTSTGGTVAITNGPGSINLEIGGAVADSFPTNSGTATPSAGALTLTGTGNISTSGSGSTATFTLSGTTNHAVQIGNTGGTLTSLGVGATGQVLIGSTAADPAFGALGVNSGLTAHGLLLGQGTSAITALADATNGQIPIGSTGADPVLGNITSTGGTVVVTNGAGTINLATSSATANSFVAGTGTATPSAGVLTVPNGSNINTTGSGSTLTIDLVSSPSVSGSLTAGTVISTAAGSAGSPSYTFTGNTNDGIYSPATNQLAISTASTQRMLVNATGTVTFNAATSGNNVTIAPASNGNSALSILAGGSSSAPAVSILSNVGIPLSVGGNGNNPSVQIAPGANKNAIQSSNGLAASPAYSFTNGTSTGLYAPANNQVALSTNSVARLSIDASGNTTIAALAAGVVQSSSVGLLSSSNGSNGQVLIGGSTSPAWANITSTGSTVAITNGANTINLETGSAVATSFLGNSGTATPSSGVLTVSGSGNITVTGSGSTLSAAITGIFGTTVGVSGIPVLVDNTGALGTVASSARFKHNITDMGERSSEVMKLRPVNFSYKGDVTNSMQYGLIAEEVHEIMPQMVTYDATGNPYTVRYHELPSVLLNELQKLARRVEELEAKLANKG